MYTKCFVNYSNISVKFLNFVDLDLSAIVLTENIWPISVLLKVVLVQGPEATATSGYLLKMQIYRPNPRLTKSEPLKVESRNPYFKEPCRR